MRELAASLVEALKGNPAVLALILSNFALLAFLFYALSGAAEARGTLIKQIADNNAALQQMLQARCEPRLELK